MSALERLQGLLQLRLLRLAALILLLTGAGVRAMRTMYCVLDPDVWWHLKVGDWILQNLAFPHSGIFSRTAANHPWIAYSWGYEVLLSKTYSWFGLMGIGLLGVALTITVAAALFGSSLKLSGKFWLAWLLTIVVGSGFLFSIMPRPVFVSMVLFAVTLTTLLEVQKNGDLYPIYWLPLVFILWANVHIQFIYGLFALGLFFGTHLLQNVLDQLPQSFRFALTPKTLPPWPLLGVLCSCILASCLGPYSFHLFQVVLNYSNAKITYSMIVELLPLDFKTPSQFIELFTAAAAFFAVGSQRKIDCFKLALLTAATLFAFRTLRDAWFLCFVSALFISDAFNLDNSKEPGRNWKQIYPEAIIVFLALGIALFLTAKNTDFNSRELDRAVGGFYPVNAANFIRENPVPGPVFNSFDWGGFLIWYMPEYPVSLDGRNDLYGDELDRRLYGVETGKFPYSDEPHFKESRLVLLHAKAPLAESLSDDPGFREVYHDKIAIVYVRR